jgi:adenine-specific DNA glycosylase
MPKRSSDLWHHALMDLGATICKPKPQCEICPLNVDCRYARGHAGTAASLVRGAAGGPLRRGARQREANGTAAVRHQDRSLRPAAYHDTDRRVRGAIVRALVDNAGGMTVRALEKQIGDGRVRRLVKTLTADGLVESTGRRIRLPN